jgi:spoIIIJ-associated protein
MTDTVSVDASADAADDKVTDAASLLVREGDIAADYLERLLDIVDYDGDIDLDVENGRAMVAIVGSELQPLIGSDGATLDALQELTRLAVQQQTGVRSRLMLDVSGHRRALRAELTATAIAVADRVRAAGQPESLDPMNPFERKVVHDAIAGIDGVISESEGEEPSRRVVVLPAS